MQPVFNYGFCRMQQQPKEQGMAKRQVFELAN